MMKTLTLSDIGSKMRQYLAAAVVVVCCTLFKATQSIIFSQAASHISLPCFFKQRNYLRENESVYKSHFKGHTVNMQALVAIIRVLRFHAFRSNAGCSQMYISLGCSCLKAQVLGRSDCRCSGLWPEKVLGGPLQPHMHGHIQLTSANAQPALRLPWEPCNEQSQLGISCHHRSCSQWSDCASCF